MWLLDILLSDGAVVGVLIVSASVSWPGARALQGTQSICVVRPLCLDGLLSLCLCDVERFVVVAALGQASVCKQAGIPWAG